MAVSINTNLNALRALRRLDEAGSARERTFERLASGSRLNHASDDAAGLAVAASLNFQAKVHGQAVRNISDGASFLNVADGAAKELKTILFRLRELAAQSSNGTFSNTQRASLDKEAQALQAEYNRVIETAKFNATSVFAGSVSIQAGAGSAAVLVVGAAMAGVAAALVGDGTFQARTSFATGANPDWVATGDFNGDGVLDLVTADNNSNTASVLLGNGDGSFQARRGFATGVSPNSVTVADLNGDGVLDLVSADTVSTTSVLLGNGDGTFQARKIFAPGVSPNSVAVADINGDGKVDLVTTNFTDNTTSVLLGNGDGTFQARKSFATGARPYSVAAVDVNGDGVLDLVAADNGSNTTSVLLGNGDGTFQAKASFAVGVNPYSVAVADINGDGVLDFITADYADSTASVLLGNGVASASVQAGLTPLTGVSVTTQGAALASQGRIDGYLDEVNLVSGAVGVGLSRLAVASANLQSNIEATRAAEARITDVDAAEESARLVANTILQQAAAAVLAHANQEPALALKLLRP